MSIELDHFIVSSRNKIASAKLLGELLGLLWAQTQRSQREMFSQIDDADMTRSSE